MPAKTRPSPGDAIGRALQGMTRAVGRMPQTENMLRSDIVRGKLVEGAAGPRVHMVSGNSKEKYRDQEIQALGGADALPMAVAGRKGVPVRKGYNYDYTTNQYVKEKGTERADGAWSFLSKLLKLGAY